VQDITSYAGSGGAKALTEVPGGLSLIQEIPDRLISIHLAYGVIERLERDVIAAFKAIPKRGAEVGGLLLGRVDEPGSRTVYIDDFAPVSCEYRRGPSYLLSDSDRAGLENTIARAGTTVVGFYRSHTRKDFGFDEEDVSRFQTYFPHSNRFFLLIKPLSISQSVARFFSWEEGAIHGDFSQPEFPFGRRWIPEHVTQAPAKTVMVEAAPIEIAVPQEPERPRRRRTWIPLAACLTAAVTGLVGFQTWEAARRPRTIQTPPASVREVKPSAMLPVVPAPSTTTVAPPPSATVATPAKTGKLKRKGHRSRLRRSSAKAKKNGVKHRLARLWPLRRSHRQ
jgi:hypothetical protein